MALAPGLQSAVGFSVPAGRTKATIGEFAYVYNV